MAYLIHGRSPEMLAWMARQVPHAPPLERWGHYRTTGVMSDDGPAAQLMAVIAWTSYNPDYGTVQVSAASVNPRWASRETIRNVLSYPFGVLNCNKVWAAVPHTNVRVSRFMRAIGFTREGILKDHMGPGVNTEVWRMLRHEYRSKYLRKLMQQKAA